MRSSTSSSRAWLRRLGLFLAGLLVFDQMVGVLVRANAPPDFVAAVRAKQGFDPGRRYDVWIIGDSLAADAFVPQVIERKTGMRSFNWGVYASSPAEWEVLLRDLEGRAPFPRFVVLGANPQMLRKKPGDGPYMREFVRSPLLRAELVSLSLREDDLGSLLAAGRARLLARSALLGLLGRGQKARVHPFPPDSGYLANTRVLMPQARPRSLPLRADTRRERLHLEALQRIAETCRRHGAKLVVAEPPVSVREMAVLRGSPQDAALYSDSLRTLGSLADVPNSSRYGVGDFYDGVHLADPAARRWSTAFARWLRTTLPVPDP